jgi:hypothetical protein
MGSPLPSPTCKLSLPRYGSKAAKPARSREMCWFAPVSRNQAAVPVKEILHSARFALGYCP